MQIIRKLSAAVLLLSVVVATGAASRPEDEAWLVGAWAMDQTFGAQLAGPVSVRAADVPVAEFGGLSAIGQSTPAGWLFRFPANRGELHTGRFTTARTSAMWVQPESLSGNPYATPAALTEIAPGTWRGTVAPLPFHLFMTMHITRADGVTHAFLRDPFFNIGRTFGVMTVVVSGHTIRFVSAKAGTLVGDLDVARASIALHLDALGPLPSFQFVRVTQTAGTAPDYREPLVTGDGWTVATAASAGLTERTVQTLVREVAGGAPADLQAPDVHSLTIARHGRLVFDRYAGGFTESTPHDTRSAGKTYADVLAGAAILQGVPLNDGTPVLSLMTQYPTVANDDPRKHAITLGNALSMSTGLDCDDNNDNSVANEDRMQSQTQQKDWYKLLLDAPMVRDPGTKAVYCSASINLAGGAIAAATHAWLPMYFDEHIAVPLEMQQYALNLSPDGQWYLGGGAYIRPRDMLKVGQVYLDKGRWHGRKIVGADWITKSLQPRQPLQPGDDYGYAWHLRSYTSGGTVRRVFEAQGNGGQILDVVPDLDLVVMMTQGNYNSYLTWGKSRDRLMQQILDGVSEQ